ncbi:MAG: TetR/AcrR family transcriptional regulator [Spirochaetes bacterium]|nr:TetR/AcrR family transcriptional regulator [Spirochaetota bacterium]
MTKKKQYNNTDSSMGRRILKDTRREEIAQALYRCLLKKPFVKTTIKDIAKEAGLNHGMLHYYFKNKEDILLYFLDWIVALHLEDFRKWAGKQKLHDLTFNEALSRAMDYAKKKITLNEELARIFIEVWEIALYHKKVRAKLQFVYKEWIEQLVSVIGKETNTKNATAMSVATIAFLEGISLFHIMLSDMYPIKDILNYFEKKIETLINDK